VLSHNSFNAQGRLAARTFYISVRFYLAKLLLLEFEKIPVYRGLSGEKI
jgi:hypothetical protein